MKISYAGFVIIGLISTAACKKVVIDNPPNPITFILLDKQEKNLLTNSNTQLKVSAINTDGKEFYIRYDSIVLTDSLASFPYKAYYENMEIPVLSNTGVKDWYLEKNGKTDTLHYDVQQYKSGAKYNVISVLFNGQKPASNITLSGIEYYIFQRRH